MEAKRKREQQQMQGDGIIPETLFKVSLNSSLITAQRLLSYLCCGSNSIKSECRTVQLLLGQSPQSCHGDYMVSFPWINTELQSSSTINCISP